MSFLYPAFLFALSAVAIPILIHLFNFRRFKKVYFSNVRFLKDIEVRTSSSKNLRRLLILFARILAIIFLVLAFAKPFIPDNASLKQAGNQVISIYLDNSYSMEAVNKDGTLLDEARRRAREIVSAYTLNDKFQLLTNDFEGRHQRLLSREEFISALDEVKISGVTRTIPQVLKRQQDIFTGEPNAPKTSYLLSDFQVNMVPDEAFVPDSTVALRFVKIGSNPLPNISVDSAWFASPIHKPGETERLIVQLRNNSDKQAENIPVKLNINKQQKAVASLSIPPRSVRSDTLSFSGLTGGWQQGEIQITDYPVVFDDKFFFSFYVKKSLPVLVISDKGFSPYLNAVYRSDPFFSLVNVSSGNLNYSGLGGYPMIILNELASIPPATSQQLKKYADNGGTLVIFPSLDADLSSLGSFLQGLGTDIPEEVVDQETKVTAMNVRHPLFGGVFEKVPQNMDLPVAKAYIRYSTQSRTSRQPILDFPGGRSFFSQYRSGLGNVYLSAVPLDDEVSNFARHSVFVPIMYQSALLSLRDGKLFYTLGRDQFLEINKITLQANQVLKLKKDNFEVIPDVQQAANSTRVYIADQVKQEGNYNLVKGDSIIAAAGFNDNRGESDLSYLDDKNLESMFPGRKVNIFNTSKASIQNEIKEVNDGMHLWKVCIILALIFLAAEVLLIRFYDTAAPKPIAS
ncbi:BatA domain-containing protein [Hufsiella ginkgonis]|uniref:Aerotolerance regulator N-terminal domain-containing protein n=1 Tax=Hufsiella ginkgonis TaxID=2695274 RepID=A0A7K1XW23_9SPHI|nr:BatA domain-containing protein [Hufsiella ginkgonis]MXV15027.1 hypothetical protein [Hufsiella ginkgonis]